MSLNMVQYTQVSKIITHCIAVVSFKDVSKADEEAAFHGFY